MPGDSHTCEDYKLKYEQATERLEEVNEDNAKLTIETHQRSAKLDKAQNDLRESHEARARKAQLIEYYRYENARLEGQLQQIPADEPANQYAHPAEYTEEQFMVAARIHAELQDKVTESDTALQQENLNKLRVQALYDDLSTKYGQLVSSMTAENY